MFSTLPPLTVVNCGDPGTPSHGIREPDPVATQLSNVVKYSCDEGYELLGSQERTCQSSGEWSGQLPTCQSELATAVVQTRGSVSIACSPSVGSLAYITCIVHTITLCMTLAQNHSIEDTIVTQPAVLYREVSLMQR